MQRGLAGNAHFTTTHLEISSLLFSPLATASASLGCPLRLRVLSRLRSEDAVENRGLYHVFVSRLLKGV